MRIAIALTFVLVASLLSLLVQDAYSHGVPSGGVSRFFRIDNGQFSTNNVTVGQTIEVTVELRSPVNRNITISQALIAVSEISAADPQLFTHNYTFANSGQWRIVNATHTEGFVLAVGETIPFSMNITSVEAGKYHVHPAFAWSYLSANGTQIDTTYYGRGAAILVMPSEEMLQRCQELGLALEKCSQTTILQNTPFPVKVTDEDGKRIEDQQNQIINSIYVIGIGVAIAGVVAFASRRRLRK